MSETIADILNLEQTIIEIENFINSNHGKNRDFYCGITYYMNENLLKVDLMIPQIWLVKKCATDNISISIYKYFIKKGLCKEVNSDWDIARSIKSYDQNRKSLFYLCAK